MGVNDNGKVYDDIHVIFKNAAQIERFIGNAGTPQQSQQRKMI